MKNYISPEMNVTLFAELDILTLSGNALGAGEGGPWGDVLPKE